MFESFKIRSALFHHQKGEVDKAKEEYAQLYNRGYIRASYMLPWSIILLREGGEANYKKAKEILAKAQKAPDMDASRRTDLLMNFAVADFKLGNIEKGLELLERAHQNNPNGNTYGALGYMYIAAGMTDKALEFKTVALEYDDEDPVILDNLGQIYYRLLDDKEKALAFFEKAHELKPGQIDTLWFLSRYDLEKGDTEEAIEKLEKAMEGRFSPLNYMTADEITKEIERLRG